MVAGTKYRGQLKKELKHLWLKLKMMYYTFIDEIHTIVGAGGARIS
jgi:ATP-dependent Clp protease ATP-binding subunit ClpA